MSSRLAFRLADDFAAVADDAWRRMDAATGFLTEREGRFLALAAACGPESGAILEIGSFKGKSTVGLATMAKHYGSGPIIAVDPHSAPSYTDPDLKGATTTFDEFQKTLQTAGVADAVEVHRAYSSELAKSWNRPIRLLWIDGDHTYDGAKADLDMFRPWLVDGAIVALHDALHPFDGPIRVMAEHILTSDQFGPAGFVGSIAWAQYRPKSGGALEWRRSRAKLAKKARRLIPFVRNTNPMGRLRFALYKLARAGVPHQALEPARFAELVSRPDA